MEDRTRAIRKFFSKLNCCQCDLPQSVPAPDKQATVSYDGTVLLFKMERGKRRHKLVSGDSELLFKELWPEHFKNGTFFGMSTIRREEGKGVSQKVSYVGLGYLCGDCSTDARKVRLFRRHFLAEALGVVRFQSEQKAREHRREIAARETLLKKESAQGEAAQDAARKVKRVNQR